jgi:hypothetical protein
MARVYRAVYLYVTIPRQPRCRCDPQTGLSMWGAPADGLIDVTRSSERTHDLLTRVNNEAGTSATTLGLRHRDELSGRVDLNSGYRTNLGS